MSHCRETQSVLALGRTLSPPFQPGLDFAQTLEWGRRRQLRSGPAPGPRDPTRTSVPPKLSVVICR